jgi:hypothetical protein
MPKLVLYPHKQIQMTESFSASAAMMAVTSRCFMTTLLLGRWAGILAISER